jgi:hypothetical protein
LTDSRTSRRTTYLTNKDVQIDAPMTRPMAETIDQNEAMRKVKRLGMTPKMNARRAAQDPIYRGGGRRIEGCRERMMNDGGLRREV